jgi:hypothetical protein
MQRGELDLAAVLPAETVNQAARVAGYVDRGSMYAAVTTMPAIPHPPCVRRGTWVIRVDEGMTSAVPRAQ